MLTISHLNFINTFPGQKKGAKRAQTGLQKGLGCSATEALSASKCGPFAMPKSLNEKIGGLLRVFQDRFPLWLEIFREHTFVKVIPL